MNFKILHHLVLKLSHSQTTLPVIIQMFKDTIYTAKANKFLKAKNFDASLSLCALLGEKDKTGFKNKLWLKDAGRVSERRKCSIW